MNNETFAIRRYGKSELAMLYMQGASKETAMRLFRDWLKVNPRLRHLVNKNAKYYYPKQVALIVEQLGEPFKLE